MKNLLYLFFLVLQANVFFAQNDLDPCVNNANTYPGASQSELYMQNIPYSDSRFLNNWIYWMDPNLLYNEDPSNPPVFTIPIFNMGQNSDEIYGDSPTTPPFIGLMEPINSNGFQDYYKYLSRSIVYKPSDNIIELLHPQNGWELLSVNRGFYPDGITTVDFNANTYLRTVPYLLFYNKYTGIARIYVRYGNNHNPQGTIHYADIMIQHQDPLKMSGMLRLGDATDRTLDQKSIISKIRARVPSPGSASLWFSADFQMHYDPCVCPHDSKIVVNFKFYTSANINIVGRSVEISGDLTNEAFNDPSFLDVSGIFNDMGQNAANGYLIYRKYGQLLQDYLKVLEKYNSDLQFVNENNKELQRNIALLKIGIAIVTGVTSGGTGVSGMPSFFALLAKIPSLFVKFDEVKEKLESENGGTTSNEEVVKDKEFEKLFLKELDKAMALGFELLIKENLKEKDKPSKPVSPTAAMSEFHFTGAIDFATPASGPEINTPGSKDAHIISASNQPWEFPVYNEALGVFALLKKPKIRISRTLDSRNQGVWKVDSVHVWRPIWQGFDAYLVGYPSFTARELIQLSLDEPLEYVINPALKTKNVDIQVLFEVDGNSPVDHSSPFSTNPSIDYSMNMGGPYGIHTNRNTIEVGNNPVQNVNIVSNVLNIEDELETFSKNYSFHSQENDIYNKEISLNSIQVPIDAAMNFIFSFSTHQSIRYPDIFRNRKITSSPFAESGIIAYLGHVATGAKWITTTNNLEELHQSDIGCVLTPTNLDFSQTGFPDNTISANFHSTHLQDDKWPTFKFQSLKMKLIINIEYDDLKLDGTPQDHTYIFTYNIDLDDIHDPIDPDSNGSIVWHDQSFINPNLAGSNGDYTQFDEVSVFNSTHFDGSVIDNCILDGTHYECKGRYSIEIEGDITVATGYTVKFVAPEVITVYPESNIAPEAELIIEPIFDLSNPIPPQTSTQVAAFCADDLYNAGQLQRSIATFYDSLAQANPAPQPEPAPIEFIVFPNPTTGASQAGLNLPELATVSISIVDITGKVQGRPVQNQVLPMGRNVLNLESEPLAPGVYFVQVVVNGEKLTQRLVKQ